MDGLKRMFGILGETWKRSQGFRVAAVTTIAGIVLIVLMSSLSVRLSNNGSDEQDTEQSQGADDGTGAEQAGDGDSGGGDVSGEAGSDAASTDGEASTQGGESAEHSSDDEQLVTLLSSYTWVADNGNISFSDDGTASIVAPDETTTEVPYDISGTDQQPPKVETVEQDGESSQITTTETNFVLTWDGATEVATLTYTDAGDAGSSYTLTSSSIGTGVALAQASSLTVVTTSDYAMDQATYGYRDELQTALRDWATMNAPLATTATWDERAQLDWNAGTATLTFSLDDNRVSEVTATLDIGNGTWEVYR